MPDPGHPDQIGPYRILSLVDSGGMGVVYRGAAEDGREVAVKVLQRTASPSVAARFEREASIRIDHENVVEVLGAAVDRGVPYIALELLVGSSLSALLEEGPISLALAIDVVRQAAAGLEAVHRAGIVHRDLKPANLFVCSDGTVKVLDFGIARVRGAENLTAEGAVIGTLGYLSPEQARGMTELDAQTDLWALGAVLFEMVAGRAPFERPSYVATLLAIIHEPVPSLGATAPSEVADVVARCLSRERDRRFASAAELRAALEAIDTSQLTAVRSASRDISAAAQTEADMRVSVRPDEQRVVAVLLARHVRDMDEVRAAVTAQGGEFFPLLGEDAIGLFGGKRLEGDEVRRAVAAALACRLAADAVGVGSGRVASSSGTLSGDALDRAEASCAAGLLGVAVPASIAHTLEGFRWQAAGDLCEVVAERPRSWRTAHAATPTGLLGRDLPLRRLVDCVESAFLQKIPSLTVVLGPPGIGKTRLVRELVTGRPDAERVLVAEGSPLTSAEPRAMLAALLSDRARRGARVHGWPRLDPHAPPVERRMALHELLGEVMDPAQVSALHVEALSEVFGVSTPRSRCDARLTADRARLAFVDYLTALTENVPTLIVLEDAHWADAVSVEVLSSLLDDARPLAIVATARAADALPLTLSAAVGEQIVLRGLGAHAVAAMVERIAGDVPEETLAALVARTEGNPLFVEQVVRDLGERLRQGVDHVPLPLSVEAAIQSRLDHLPEAEKEMCKWASLFGRPFRAREMPPTAGERSALDALVRREILNVVDGRYEFDSPLLAEVAARLIAPQRRQQMHLSVARTLTEIRASEPEEVARHFESADRTQEARAQYARATRRAQQRGDVRGVLHCSSRALALQAGSADAFALHLARADALRAEGRRDEQRVEIDAALDAASTDGERVEASIERVAWLVHVGRLDEARALADEVVALASTDREIALARGRRAEVLARLGRHADAAAEAEAALSALPDASETLVEARIHEWSAIVSASLGDTGAARHRFQRAADLFARGGDLRRAAGNAANLADVHNRLGDHGRALEALAEARRQCDRLGFRSFEVYVLVNTARALIGVGRLEDALATLDRADAAAAETSSSLGAAGARLYRAQALYHLGRHGAALGVARELASDAAEREMPDFVAMACSWSARAALALGRLEEADADSARAIDERDRLGGVPEDEATIFVVRAQALRAIGRELEAAEVERRGRARLEELADRIADRDVRERFRTGPHDHRALVSGSAP